MGNKDLKIDFDNKQKLYEELILIIEKILSDALEKSGISSHLFQFRIKSKESFEEKISRPEGNYSKLDDITDIAGGRIITYFEYDIESVAKLVEKLFVVDFEKSVDLKNKMDSTKFGYISLHYICELSNRFLKNPDYEKFKGLKFEIQIRTFLQHVWAEIEHDLGYKSKTGIPQSVRRRFSRLAGLLELADDEFNEISKTLKEYEIMVSYGLSRNPRGLGVDSVTLETFIKKNRLIKKLDLEISKLLSTKYIHNGSVDVIYIIKMFDYVGIKNVEEVNRELENKKDSIAHFLKIYKKYLKSIGSHKYKKFVVYRGYCLFFLGYLLILGKQSTDLKTIDYFAEFLSKYDKYSEEEAKRRARLMIDAYSHYNN